MEEKKTLTQKLGEVCHMHYEGCNMRTGYWQYRYDTEVIEILESDEAQKIVQQEIDRVRKEQREITERMVIGGLISGCKVDNKDSVSLSFLENIDITKLNKVKDE